MTLYFYCKSFSGVSYNLDLKRIIRFKMFGIRKIESLKSLEVEHRLNSPIFVAVTEDAFFF